MTAVNSSNIAGADYENSVLYVQFHNGGLYAYYGVPYSGFSGLVHANSPGGYLATHIKPYYRYRRIR